MSPSINLIAPCGMNCGLCLYYLRPTNTCPGCSSGRKVNHVCNKYPIKLCKNLQGDFCFNCSNFPCPRLKRLDKRYKEKYGMSEIENLLFIKEKGICEFVKQEKKKWVNQDGTFCVHNKTRYSK